MIATDAVEAALLLSSLKPGKYDLGGGVTFELTEIGERRWRRHGKLHRENGPAVEYENTFSKWCMKEWWFNGHLHRKGGPAVESTDGEPEWWINGARVK